ncbi:MAG TPA: asparaginase [Candidatus Baltobacteraceae bacterium]
MNGIGTARVEVRRGAYLESVHTFSACIVRADGEVIDAFGDVEHVYPVRSLAKPFLAAMLASSGAAEAYEFDEADIALAAGSHDGEQRHVEAVRRILARLDLDENALLCGPAKEGRAVIGPPIANNCSGKHAAVLALCRHLGYSVERYVEPTHPVQVRLLSTIMPAFGVSFGPHELAVDGCDMPIFGASLRQIAVAYARFGVAEDEASTRVRGAMTAQPAYVGGWQDNLDTQLIEWSHGAIIGKIGAEGLHADAILTQGIALAVKVHDGNSRALPSILAQLIPRCADPSPLAAETLANLAKRPVFNAVGRTIGGIALGAELVTEELL